MNNHEKPGIPVEEVLDIVKHVFTKKTPQRTISLTLINERGLETVLKKVMPHPNFDDAVFYMDVYGNLRARRLNENVCVIKITYEPC